MSMACDWKGELVESWGEMGETMDIYGRDNGQRRRYWIEYTYKEDIMGETSIEEVKLFWVKIESQAKTHHWP